jgi:hypothetical protein
MSNTLLKTTLPSSKLHLAVAPLVDRGDQVGTQSRTANPYRSLRARRASAKTHAAHTYAKLLISLIYGGLSERAIETKGPQPAVICGCQIHCQGTESPLVLIVFPAL